jgi:ubiquinone/menaquinone biosynthesis C-methylase UbiE
MQAERRAATIETELSIKEAEALSYYDFMSYLGVPYFHIGGIKSTEKLAELCKIDQTRKVLIVGCGTGFSACHLARKIRCAVVGIDIAELSVEKAKERAKIQGISERLTTRS